MRIIHHLIHILSNTASPFRISTAKLAVNPTLGEGYSLFKNFSALIRANWISLCVSVSPLLPRNIKW